MTRIFTPVLLAVALSACNSSDISVQGSSGSSTLSTITIPANAREVLTSIPNIAFNGQYETVARAELGAGGGGASAETDDSVDGGAELAVADSIAVEDRYPLPGNPNQTIEPGTLTAGDYDDQLNPYLYQLYASDYLQRRGQWIDTPRLDFNNRIRIEVSNKAGQPYAHAKVEVLRDNGQQSIELYTAANGVASLYRQLDSLAQNFTLRVTDKDGISVEQSIDRQAAIDAGRILVSLASTEQPIAPAVDVMFVMDTTGSMSDELNFLQTELSDIINAASLQQSGLKTGLVFYRDYGDNYVVRAHGFSDDLNSVQLNLNQEQARGGGDYPEAMDQALQAAIGADWRADSRKILFLIADAPPHSDRMRATWTAAEQARRQNIHIVPVAASGVAEDAEYIMRSVAALTNSRYLFLTDDSGYGLSHAEPEIDCYVVTSLRNAMIRAVNTLVTGKHIEPADNDIIRKVGNYDAGICKQDSSSNQQSMLNSTVLVNRQYPLNGTFTEKQTRVIASQQSLNEALSVYGESNVDADFEAGSVVLVDSGQKSSGGYSVEITSFEEFNDHVVANIVFTQPGRNCGVTTALTNPYTFVYVATRKEIRTVQTIVSTDCSA